MKFYVSRGPDGRATTGEQDASQSAAAGVTGGEEAGARSSRHEPTGDAREQEPVTKK